MPGRQTFHAVAAPQLSPVSTPQPRPTAAAMAARPLALAMHLVLAASLIASAGWSPGAHAQTSQEQAGSAPAAQAQADDVRHYDIPAGPLSRVLTRFSTESGIFLGGATDLAQGKTSPGLQGQYSVEEALRTLLAGSGLSYRFTGEDRVTLVAVEEGNGPVRLEPINVEAAGEWAYGPVEGYKAERSATATRTDTPIQDVPVSIQVVPREVIDDQNAQDLQEVVRNVSGVFVDNSFGGIGFDFNIRGFLQDFKLRNGFREEGTATTRIQELANVERVEVLKGPASIISGRLAPGGVINIVTKRPTAVPLRRFELEGGTTSEGGVLLSRPSTFPVPSPTMGVSNTG